MLDFVNVPLSENYIENYKSSTIDPGCIRLYRAILESALIDLRRSRYQAEAVRWFMSERTDQASFLIICGLLSLDASEIRRKVTSYLGMNPKDRSKSVKSRLLP